MKFELNNLDVIKPEGHKEVVIPFPMVKELFELAEDKLPELSFLIYTDPKYRKENQMPVELPEKFSSMTADYPGKYFLVYYENRSGSYYAPGTRMKQVGLSSSRYRYESDLMLREIDIKQPDASEGKGNVIFLTVSNLINEKSVLDLNTAEGLETDRPHGSAKITYEVDSSGKREVRESHFTRLDEAVFSWKDEQKPVRWLRNLDTENLPAGVTRIDYKDYYMIGRDEKGDTEERAQIRTHIEGGVGGVKSVLIEIGLGTPSLARTIFENEDGSVKVVEHSPKGMKAFTNQMEIVRQDPNYAFLFEQPVSQEKVLAFVKSRIEMLERDWDKTHPVFGPNQIEGLQTGMIE